MWKLLKMNSILNNIVYVTSLNKGCRAQQTEGGVLLGEIQLMLNRFCLPVKTQKHGLGINKTLLTFSCADYM